MTTSLRILMVDDDPQFNQTYSDRLSEEGYVVESALTAPDALKRLEERPFDLVLLDRKFKGRDAGLDMIGQIRNRTPGAKIILITAYADAASVNRAFEEGVYDYLEKNLYFEAILLIKVRNALEAVRERRFAALANGQREQTIKELWQQVQTEKSRQRKGRVLEDLLLILFKSIPGFERAETNERSQNEEFDLLVPNESPDPFWQKESQYFLVECKNWSAPVDPKEIDRLHQKLERRHARIQLGFLVALKGFTAGVEATLAASRKEPTAIALVQAPELRRLVEAGPQRNDVLKEIHRKSVLRG